MHIIIVGSVGNGFSAIGPFESAEAAIEFASGDAQIRDGYWEVLPIDPPEGIG